MSNGPHVSRQPGIGYSQTATPRNVFLGGELYLPGGKVIDGSKSRDIDSGKVYDLAAGLLMGKITASGKYAPSIIGLTGVAHDTSAVTTTMTLPAAVVTEIQRRIGASGTFKITGPPTAAGTVATETVTYSAIASSTTITITATSADFAAGSLITPTDGSETPLTVVPNGYPIRVVDEDLENIDVPFAQLPVGGIIDSSQLRSWSSDASVKAYIVGLLDKRFTFDHLY